MSLNLASLNQRYNALLSLVNSIISGLIPVVTSSPLSVVLTNGNSAGTNDIDMNDNNIDNVVTIESNTNLNLNSISGVRTNNNIVTNSPTFNQRQITTSYYNICDGGALQNAVVPTGRIFSLGAGTFFDFTIVNNSSLNFQVRRANTNFNPLIMTDVSTFKTSIVQDVAGSVINQSSLQSDPTLNTFKNTQIVTNFGGPSANPSLDVYDSGGGGRGLRFVAFANGGNYLPITGANDSVIVSRFRPMGGNIGLTIGLVNSQATCIRFSSETPNKGKVEIGAGSTNRINILDDSDPTFPDTTTFNREIRMVGTTSNSRRISGISRSQFFDINGFGGTGQIFLEGSTDEFSYVCDQVNHRHAFFTNDGINTNKRLTISDTSINQTVATDSTAVTTFTTLQNGFTDVFNSATIVYPSQSTISGLAFFNLVRVGTYIINLSISLINNNPSNNINNVNNHWGLSENNSTLPSSGLLANSIIRQQGLSVASGGTRITTTTSSIFRATTASKNIFINGFAEYTGSATADLEYVISWVKIA